MHNPFSEITGDDHEDAELVRQSKDGDRDALERLILRHQAWIFNIAVRMVFHPQDAEEVTQEVLVKVITRLSTFQGQSKFRTWLYRITANHVLNMIYAASKSALGAITGVLAKELAPRRIRVNSINPGATLSEGTQAAGLYGAESEFEKALVERTPLGRLGTPADIAKVTLFLASDDSLWLTGEVILASGGLR